MPNECQNESMSKYLFGSSLIPPLYKRGVGGDLKAIFYEGNRVKSLFLTKLIGGELVLEVKSKIKI